MSANASLVEYDGITGIAIAVMLLVIVFQGNGFKLVEALKGETGFLKWVLALFILSYLSNSGVFGEAGTAMLTGVYILLLMKIAQNQQIMGSISKLWNSL